MNNITTSGDVSLYIGNIYRRRQLVRLEAPTEGRTPPSPVVD